MKRMNLLSALLLAASCCAVQAMTDAKVKTFVSIDSIAIMQRSLEGQELAGKVQKEVEAFQSDVKNVQKELNDQQEALAKQAKVLSKDAIIEKTEELSQKKKKHERDFADKEEALRMSIQKKQIALRDKQLVVINEVFEKEGWGALIDKNTPGLLCVSDAIDKTEQVLSAIDAKYKVAPAAKAATTVKTASNDSTKDEQKKQTVKVA